MILYAKLGLAGAILLAIFGLGFHWGGASARAAAERLRADQLQATNTALQAQIQAREMSERKLQEVTDQYDAIKDLPDPAATVIARRLYIRSCSDSVPQAASVAGGTQTPTPVPVGPSSIAERLGDFIAACNADAAQLSAVIQLAP